MLTQREPTRIFQSVSFVAMDGLDWSSTIDSFDPLHSESPAAVDCSISKSGASSDES